MLELIITLGFLVLIYMAYRIGKAVGDYESFNTGDQGHGNSDSDVHVDNCSFRDPLCSRLTEKEAKGVMTAAIILLILIALGHLIARFA